MKSVALLSHRFGNIGHTFMSLGAEAIVRHAFGPKTKITHFEQHHVFSVYPDGYWLGLLDSLSHSRLIWLRTWLGKPSSCERFWPKTLPLDFDLAVACGGPNLIETASRMPQHRLLLHHFNGAFHYRGVPLVDAGIGSAFPLERIPKVLAPDDEAFYRRALSLTCVATVRDKVAKEIFQSIGSQCPVIPCMAIASGKYFEKFRPAVPSPSDQHIAINFQARGSNDDWSQNVDPSQWMGLVRNLIEVLRRRHKIVLLCHSRGEQLLAAKLAPDLPAVLPVNEAEYGAAIANTKVGFVSRIHAAIALAGIGVPSVVVGNDTRIETVREMSLPAFFTKQVTSEVIVSKIEEMITGLDAERERLLALRSQTIEEYSELFRKSAKGY